MTHLPTEKSLRDVLSCDEHHHYYSMVRVHYQIEYQNIASNRKTYDRKISALISLYFHTCEMIIVFSSCQYQCRIVHQRLSAEVVYHSLDILCECNFKNLYNDSINKQH